MVMLWDYDKKKLEKTKSGRILILERQINHGVDYKNGEKIKLNDVKKYWNELHLQPDKRRLFEFLIWGK